MNRIVHFEIQVDDPERAIAFYTKVFGWQIDKYPGLGWDYWGVMTTEKDSTEPGINGGLLRRPTKLLPDQCGANSYVCTVVVADFDAMAEKILSAGGVVAMPKFPLAPVRCRFAGGIWVISRKSWFLFRSQGVTETSLPKTCLLPWPNVSAFVSTMPNCGSSLVLP